MRGRSDAVRHQLRGLVVLGVGLAVTSGSLGLLQLAGVDDRRLEVVVLTLANLVVTMLRFVAMRLWVFGRRRSR